MGKNNIHCPASNDHKVKQLFTATLRSRHGNRKKVYRRVGIYCYTCAAIYTGKQLGKHIVGKYEKSEKEREEGCLRKGKLAK